MDVFQQVLTGIFCLAVLIAAFKLFTAPMKWIFKLVINVVFGFAGLFLFNLAGAGFGLSLGVNWINALILGVLGLPGFALLLILQLLT